MASSLDEEARDATALLAGKAVRHVWRHREEEVAIEFDDGTRLFVDAIGGGAIELSVTDGQPSG